MAVRPIVEISQPTVTVEPGQIAQSQMKVKNVGGQVAHYRVGMVEECVAASWTQFAPPEFSLMPGDDRDVIVMFRPPLDSTTPSGSFPYGVRVTPGDGDGQSAAVEEGDVIVGAIHALQVKVRPRRSRGRWRGRHRVVLHNRGTEDVLVTLSAADEEEALSFGLAPTKVTVPASGDTEAFLKVRPRTPMLRGKVTSHPFNVVYKRRTGAKAAVMSGGPPAGGEVEGTADGVFEQKPIISALMLVVFALVVAAIAFIAWRIQRPVASGPVNSPDPPTDLSVEAAADGTSVTFSVVSGTNHESLEFREVTCETKGNIVPTPLGDSVVKEEVDAGQGVFPVSEFTIEAGAAACYQARGLNSDGRFSVWSPVPALETRVALLGEVEAPSNVTAQQSTESTTLMVSWTFPEELSDEARFAIVIDNQPTATDVRCCSTPIRGLEPGEHSLLIEATTADGDVSESEALSVSIEEADVEPAGPGSSPRPEGPFWLMLQRNENPGLDISDTIIAMARSAGIPNPRPATVSQTIIEGEDTVLVPSGSQAAEVVEDGQRMFFADGIVDLATAEAHCLAFNTAAAALDDPTLHPVCSVFDTSGTFVSAPLGE